MAGPVEDVVELHGVVAPAGRDGGGVLIEPGQERHMARSGLCGNSGVGETHHSSPLSLLLDEPSGPRLVEALAPQSVRHHEDQSPGGGRELRAGRGGEPQDGRLEVDVEDGEEEYQVEGGARQSPNPVVRHLLLPGASSENSQINVWFLTGKFIDVCNTTTLV